MVGEEIIKIEAVLHLNDSQHMLAHIKNFSHEHDGSSIRIKVEPGKFLKNGFADLKEFRLTSDHLVFFDKDEKHWSDSELLIISKDEIIKKVLNGE